MKIDPNSKLEQVAQGLVHSSSEYLQRLKSVNFSAVSFFFLLVNKPRSHEQCYPENLIVLGSTWPL